MLFCHCYFQYWNEEIRLKTAERVWRCKGITKWKPLPRRAITGLVYVPEEKTLLTPVALPGHVADDGSPGARPHHFHRSQNPRVSIKDKKRDWLILFSFVLMEQFPLVGIILHFINDITVTTQTLNVWKHTIVQSIYKKKGTEV